MAHQPRNPADEFALSDRIAKLLEIDAPRYRRLWDYYRNSILPRTNVRDEQGSDRPYRQAQEWGLPSRITGVRSGQSSPQVVDDVARKEVVIENDIAWRIDALIDFLFGKPIVINSTAAASDRAGMIQTVIREVIAHNGGMPLLQQLALTGAIWGFVDVLVKLEPASDAAAASCGDGAGDGAASLTPAAESASRAGMCCSDPHPDDPSHPGASNSASLDALRRIARMVRLEIVEPARALPVLSDTDWRKVLAYGQVYRLKRKRGEQPRHARSRWLWRVLTQIEPLRSTTAADDSITITELITPHAWHRYEDDKLVASGVNCLGEIPLVHIQNLAIPLQYPGASDVEPLLPLQDELNTRLSDRANRITMQSFRMYLGKGIEGFTSLPMAPGRMWMTDNNDAEVIEFGGDANCPSEDRHIAELREALDKASGVTPIAAGAIRGRIGNLTSAAALRVTMMALLAKTERKRTTYGQGIARMCELALAWLDRAGLLSTSPDERGIEIHWPSPIPDSAIDKLREAQAKRSVGVARQTVLKELGY